jgi:hypothetical protein
MILRDWEHSMAKTGAIRLRVTSHRRGEYDASAILAGRELTVTSDDMQAACARLLERCQEEVRVR